MLLNKENYFSKDADAHYLSVSQFKAIDNCEGAAIATLKGEWERTESTAFTVGSYTHVAFETEEVLNTFVEENYSVIFNNKGKKYAAFEQADKMVETIKNDKLSMFAMTGDKEVIMTGSIGGVEWKIKIDNINLERGYFSDLKTTKSLYDRFWSSKYGDKHVSFVHHYGYILQMAVYQEVIRQNTGKILEPYIVAVTKETVPDKEIIAFSQDDLSFELEYVKEKLPIILAAKKEQRYLKRCGRCDYCKSTKILNNPINVNFLLD